MNFIGENGVTVTGATAGDVRNITVKGTKVESKTNDDGSYTITITNPDNTTSTMTVRNGLNGKDGAAGAKGEKGDRVLLVQKATRVMQVLKATRVIQVLKVRQVKMVNLQPLPSLATQMAHILLL